MAKQRSRARGDDERRYPNFEGVGPNFAGPDGAGTTFPGANRGVIDSGVAYGLPGTTAGLTRLEGLQQAASVSSAFARRGNSSPVQGGGTMNNPNAPSGPPRAVPRGSRGGGASQGKIRGRSVRG